MPFDQYHEPFEKLPEETRTFARLIMSMIEEADAINWYEQRIAVEADEEARQVMVHAQKEEFIHFGMDLASLEQKLRSQFPASVLSDTNADWSLWAGKPATMTRLRSPALGSKPSQD